MRNPRTYAVIHFSARRIQLSSASSGASRVKDLRAVAQTVASATCRVHAAVVPAEHTYTLGQARNLLGWRPIGRRRVYDGAEIPVVRRMPRCRVGRATSAGTSGLFGGEPWSRATRAKV